jgi:phosphatidylserine decarboxylase
MPRDAEALEQRFVRELVRIAPKRVWSSLLGWLARRPVPRAVRREFFTRYAELFAIDLDEIEHPLESYETIDAFFTRRLRPGARPIDGAENVAVSPVDGELVAQGVLAGDRLLQVKGCEYELGALLGGDPEASRFVDGTFATLYLAPRDYHRIHTPVAGGVIGARHIVGELFPVNARAVRDIRGLYTLNERVITYVDGGAFGLLGLVKVAACGVGHITLSYDEHVHSHAPRCFGRRDYTPARPVGKGEEIAIFHLGSTVIVLFEPGRIALEPVVAGAHLRCGVPLARLRGGVGE